MAFVVRRIVSKNKKRFQEDGFDLDLAYITDRIIAMALPSEGREALYRNPMSEVFQFINRYHAGHCKVYNLCCERSYDNAKLKCPVTSYYLQDHQAPPLHVIEDFCKDADAYLQADARNVIAVHCKAGKGRTGALICAYLLYKGMCSSSEEAFELYGKQRTHDGRGLTIPSQRRFVQYYERMLRYPATAAQPRRLARITISGLPEKLLQQLMVALSVRPEGEALPRPLAVMLHRGCVRKDKCWTEVGNTPALQVEGKHAVIRFADPCDEDGSSSSGLLINGDLKVQVYSSSVASKSACLFFFWLNPAHMDPTTLAFSAARWELDRVKSRVPENILVEAQFAADQQHVDDATQKINVVNISTDAAAGGLCTAVIADDGTPVGEVLASPKMTSFDTERVQHSSSRIAHQDAFLRCDSSRPEDNYQRWRDIENDPENWFPLSDDLPVRHRATAAFLEASAALTTADITRTVSDPVGSPTRRKTAAADTAAAEVVHSKSKAAQGRSKAADRGTEVGTAGAQEGDEGEGRAGGQQGQRIRLLDGCLPSDSDLGLVNAAEGVSGNEGALTGFRGSAYGHSKGAGSASSRTFGTSRAARLPIMLEMSPAVRVMQSVTV